MHEHRVLKKRFHCQWTGLLGLMLVDRATGSTGATRGTSRGIIRKRTAPDGGPAWNAGPPSFL